MSSDRSPNARAALLRTRNETSWPPSHHDYKAADSVVSLLLTLDDHSRQPEGGASRVCAAVIVCDPPRLYKPNSVQCAASSGRAAIRIPTGATEDLGKGALVPVNLSAAIMSRAALPVLTSPPRPRQRPVPMMPCKQWAPAERTHGFFHRLLGQTPWSPPQRAEASAHKRMPALHVGRGPPTEGPPDDPTQQMGRAVSLATEPTAHATTAVAESESQVAGSWSRRRARFGDATRTTCQWSGTLAPSMHHDTCHAG